MFLAHHIGMRMSIENENKYNRCNFYLQALCTETYKVVPSMAFIIVKKRISTRFFLPNSRTKSYVNPPPGTVIDTTVTDPTM